MARIWHGGAELGHEHAEGLVLSGTGTMTHDTGIKRTGARSWKFDASAALQLRYSFTGAVGTTYYFCGYYWFPSATGMPTTSNTDIMRINTAAPALIATANITSGGKLRLLNSASAQVGSDSVATMTTDTWYRVEMVVLVNASTNDDTLALYLDGVQVASSTTQSVGTTAPGQLVFGWPSDPGTSEVVYVDDVAINDDQISTLDGLVGDHHVYVLLPKADDSRVAWVNGAAGTTNLFDAVDNIPPTGVSVASSGATNQIEDPDNNASNIYTATMQTYTEVGIGATDVITAIMPVAEFGSNSTTGSDTITLQMVSNPSQVAGVSGSCDTVAGTYPSGWIQTKGNMEHLPTVVKGTSPILRVVKTGANSRANSCCLMALVVDVVPGSAARRYTSPIMVG